MRTENEIKQAIQLGTDQLKFSLDEMTTFADISELNTDKFSSFFEKLKEQRVEDTGLSMIQLLQNMNLAKEGKLTLAGLLLFGENIETYKPFALIRAINFPSNAISADLYIDKRDCLGSLDKQFKQAMLFLKNNLAYRQVEPSFNSPGVLEIDEKVLEESLVNALLHRDYSKNAVIRLLIFKDRIEIISPGSLPNHLTIENIKNGNSVMRNPLLASYGTKILPYSGIGSGIPRIIKNHPETEFINDKDGEQFTIILKRPVRP